MGDKRVFIVALDFEATCDEDSTFRHEIIEFPMIVMDWISGETLGTFHKYVRPVNNPVLTDFCRKLTGITQEQVDQADTFPVVYKEALEFLQPYQKDPNNIIIFVTFGKWDLRRMLPDQCIQSGIFMDLIEDAWFLNIRTITKQIMTPSGTPVWNERDFKIPDMMEYLGLDMHGQLHSGIDDTTNILRAMQKYRELKFGFGVDFADNTCTKVCRISFSSRDKNFDFKVEKVVNKD